MESMLPRTASPYNGAGFHIIDEWGHDERSADNHFTGDIINDDTKHDAGGIT